MPSEKTGYSGENSQDAYPPAPTMGTPMSQKILGDQNVNIFYDLHAFWCQHLQVL